MRPDIGDRVQKVDYDDTGTVIHLQMPGGEWLPSVAYVKWDSTGASWEPTCNLFPEGQCPHIIKVDSWPGWAGVEAFAGRNRISTEQAARELIDRALADLFEAAS